MFGYNFIVVGAGFAGSVIAERIASQLNEKVLVIEKKKHIGGHCYDFIDENGIITHRYGPHLFHTDSKKVWEYLSAFTDWHYYQHRVQASVDGQLIPLPFNLDSLNRLFPRVLAEKIEKKLLDVFSLNQKIPIQELLKHQDEDIRNFAQYVFLKIFKNYTAKQWNVDPDKLDPEVTARVPVLIGKDDRYFQDTYQAVPREGYTNLFYNLLNHQNIKLLLGLDFKEIGSLKDNRIIIGNSFFDGMLIYTGSIDELFEYRFGALPYRSLRLEFLTIEKEYYQPVGTVNYPNNYQHTRITEFKHIHPASTQKTKILIEYPDSFETGKNDPYYPLFTAESRSLYERYVTEASKVKNLLLLGRLAEYKYYDMDDIVLRALELFDREIKP